MRTVTQVYVMVRVINGEGAFDIGMDNVILIGADIDADILLADGFDAALIGYVERFGSPAVALYDREKCIGILTERDEMTREEAEEYFEFNVIGAYVGEYTPSFATLLERRSFTDSALMCYAEMQDEERAYKTEVSV